MDCFHRLKGNYLQVHLSVSMKQNLKLKGPSVKRTLYQLLYKWQIGTLQIILRKSKTSAIIASEKWTTSQVSTSKVAFVSLLTGHGLLQLSGLCFTSYWPWSFTADSRASGQCNSRVSLSLSHFVNKCPLGSFDCIILFITVHVIG